MKPKLPDNPYGRFVGDELILRDELALDRTLLASERTMLSYIRTALGLVIVGGTVIKLELTGWHWLDWLAAGTSFSLAGYLGVVGVMRHIGLLRVYRPIRDEQGEGVAESK